jgi:ribonuclease HI
MNGSGATGVVLRDDRGEAVAGLACPLSNVLSALTVEATTLLKSLEFLQELGVMSVCMKRTH